MHKLISKYVTAFQNYDGSSTEKVKRIMMFFAASWGRAVPESIITDLIDDVNITAQDIVDYLADIFETEGGNEEFHYAVRALQICLRKAELATFHQATTDESEISFAADSFGGYESEFFMPKQEFLANFKY